MGGYAKDDRPTAITYLYAVNPTPNVSLMYDPYFPRVTSMTDGTGTTTYSYVPVGLLGALQIQQESTPLTGASIGYTYDPLGRVSVRAVSGAAADGYGYDTIGRLSTHTSGLGSFSYTYLGQSTQVVNRSLAGATLSTSWSYLPNSGDRRLAGIDTTGLSSGQQSSYRYVTTPENFISSITETDDQGVAPTPTPMPQSASYNNLNQVTTLSGQAITWDANGNMLSDGQRTYSWDAESRLVGIGYSSQSGKTTAFSYDGFGRRVAITSTPAVGGSSTTKSYIWCGTNLCQARDGNGAVVRSYYPEGELATGSPIYYGVDQLGSVRRAFASAEIGPAYAYDPNGNPYQAKAPLTDLGYSGLMNNQESGLYLATFRVYDPVSGRWLSRDPMSETGGVNLYAYVGGNPVSFTDFLGLQTALPIPLGPQPNGGGSLPLGSVPQWFSDLLSGIQSPVLNTPDETVPPRGLPPEGVNPPSEGQCTPGPASRPSERDKGGQSLWDPKGGEWRWFPENKWHNPHWDYNPHDTPSSPWQNIPHGGLPPVKS